MSKLPQRHKTLSGELAKEFDVRRHESRRASSLTGTGLEVVDPTTGTTTQGSVRIPFGGQLIVDGGDVLMLDTDGSELLRIGIQEQGDRGLTIRREDGTIALEIRKIFGPGDASQVLRILDRTGRTIAGDALLSFTGFDAPHIPLHFIPTDYTSAATAQSTTSATFVATHEHRGLHQNPGLAPVLMAMCSDATTAGEIQFYDVLTAGYLGGYLGSPSVHTISVPAGTTAWTEFTLPSQIQLPGNMSDAMHLQIHARVTAGTGSVSVAPVRSIGAGI